MPTHRFRARHRISHARDYHAVFNARSAKSRGPLTVFLLPTNHPEHRLGLSIGKRVGGATVRVRLKRAIRESIRLDRPVYPSPSSCRSYDIVISARRHKPLSLQDYRSHIKTAIESSHRELEHRSQQIDRST
ncbi:MAG: ribonuclease P protein component [Phycisphaerales bacterium]